MLKINKRCKTGCRSPIKNKQMNGLHRDEAYGIYERNKDAMKTDAGILFICLMHLFFLKCRIK